MAYTAPELVLIIAAIGTAVAGIIAAVRVKRNGHTK